MRDLKKGFVSITIIILSTFFVTVIIAVNSFNSQINYSNEKNIIEKQAYYNAYAGIQKAVYEITQNRNYDFADYILIGEYSDKIDPTSQRYYTYLKVANDKDGTLYGYTIESIGYGRFKESIVEQRIVAKITVDYIEKTGIIRFDNIEIK